MGKQAIIEKIQTWLNQTYKNSAGYNPIAVTGTPGWDTTNAMLIAYQIEDGVSTSIIDKETSSGIYDFAGDGFTPVSAGTSMNKLMILQGAFYVMGINPGGFGVPYNSNFESAVSTLQSNAGIAVTGIADLLVVKALLSMDSFTVLTQYGGVEAIAEIQRALNGEYAQEMGELIPCDGVYGRELNKALIFAFQRTENLSVADANEADGYFGPGTQKDAPKLVQGDENYFVTILQYALYCNGYTGVSFTGTYDSATQSAVASFGRAMGISTNGGSEVNLDVWMGLLLSSGNPNRGVSGCDAAQTLSLEDAQILKAKGYDIVGRYLTGNFQTSVAELTNILKAGLNVFPIYETGSYEISYFSGAQGASDAISAVKTCRKLGIPEQTTIYFTVDYDMEGGQIQNLVLPYFKELYTTFNNAQFNYNIGVYGSRNVCKEVIEAGYAELAFVDGASTGYSGNMGYPMPVEWAFNQIKEGVTVDGIQIDNDQVSGRDKGFNQITLSTGNVVSNTSKTVFPKVSSNVETLAEKIISDLANTVLNIKTKPLGGLEHAGERHWLSKDLVYIRADEGIKGDFLSGSFITIYGGTDSNVDITASGVGINTSILFNEAETFLEGLYKMILTAFKERKFIEDVNLLNDKVSLEIYPKFPGEIDEDNPKCGMLEGYYEIGVEVGIELTLSILNQILKKYKISVTNKELLSLVGAYGYVDLVIGFNKDGWDWFDYIVKKIVASAIIWIIGKALKNFNSNELSFNPENEGVQWNTNNGKEFINAFSSPDAISQLKLPEFKCVEAF